MAAVVMGRYADSFNSRLRARLLAKDIQHPTGLGVVMWCGRCRGEILRAPKGQALPLDRQRAAYDAHMTVCELRHLDGGPTRRKIERVARRILRRQAWRRYRVYVLFGLLVVLAVWVLCR